MGGVCSVWGGGLRNILVLSYKSEESSYNNNHYAIIMVVCF